jgi:hypothetical protein
VKHVQIFEVDQSIEWVRTDSGMVDTIKGLKTAKMVDAIE